MAAVVGDARRPVQERAKAVQWLAYYGASERVVPTLTTLLLDRSVELDLRLAVASALGRLDDPRALEALVAVAGEAEPRIQHAVVAPLAARPEPEARQAAVAILAAPEVEDWAISAVWAGGAEAVWEAWRATGDDRLLAQLAYCCDSRVRAACGGHS